MILLLTSCAAAAECAAELAAATGERTLVVSHPRQDVHWEEVAEAAIVVADENLLESSPGFAEHVLSKAAQAAPVFVNFAICSRERLAREVRMALERRRREQIIAATAARDRLRNEVTGTVTGILLAAELALKGKSLSPETEEKLRRVHSLALELQQRLAPSAEFANPSARRARHSA